MSEQFRSWSESHLLNDCRPSTFKLLKLKNLVTCRDLSFDVLSRPFLFSKNSIKLCFFFLIMFYSYGTPNSKQNSCCYIFFCYIFEASCRAFPFNPYELKMEQKATLLKISSPQTFQKTFPWLLKNKMEKETNNKKKLRFFSPEHFSVGCLLVSGLPW